MPHDCPSVIGGRMKCFVRVGVYLGHNVKPFCAEAIHERRHALPRNLKVINRTVLHWPVHIKNALDAGFATTEPKQDTFTLADFPKQVDRLADLARRYLNWSVVHLCRPLHTCQSCVRIPPNVNLSLPLTVSQESAMWLE